MASFLLLPHAPSNRTEVKASAVKVVKRFVAGFIIILLNTLF
ncbi:hypothetical protein RSSL_02135 [Streptococcus salivarius K12]|uniref:Uncharacterized protein n=1 Tax=Streptococcus salivarius K12 TaxID=1200793 RepID=J7SIB6_STRSL|nr:hypothetical protein RSSL_02135 [Streptococcus salivarius K12]